MRAGSKGNSSESTETVSIESCAAYLTSPGAMVGTVAYMSPEQVRAKELDRRTDLFSFGAVLYEIATGRIPFEGASSGEICGAILHETPVPASQVNAEIGGEVEAVINKALEKDRNLRYQHASEIQSDLQRVKRDREAVSHRTVAPAKRQVESTSVALVSNVPTADSTRATSLPKHHNRVIVAIATIVIAAAAYVIYAFQKHSGPTAFGKFSILQIPDTGKALRTAISPDGRYLLNVQDDNGKESLWLRNIPTGSDTQVLPLSASLYRSLVFSPDGNYVYYREATNKLGGTFNLYRVPVLGGTPQLLVKDIDTGVTFSPDGSRMTYVRWQDPDPTKSRLLSATMDGTDEQILRIGAYFPVLNSVAWSPDGKRIACSLIKPDNDAGGIDMFDIATRQMRRFVRWDDKTVVDLKWLPSGNGLIVLFENKMRRDQIGFVSYPNGQFGTITNDTSDYSNISLSANGRMLATVQEGVTSEIDILSGTGGAMASVPLKSNRSINDVTWTRDGKLLVSEDTRLVQIAGDGSSEKMLLTDASGWIPEIESCPQGQSIVFWWSFHAGSTAENVWRADPDGSNLVQLSKGKADVYPVCSGEGKWVYFIDVPNARIMRVPLTGGTPEQVRGNTIAVQLAISRDSSTLAYMTLIPENHGAPQKLAMVNVANGSKAATKLLEADKGTGFVQFTPDSTGIAYTIEDHGVGNIWVQAIDGSNGRQITNFTSGTISAFRWSPDGKSLVVHRKQHNSDIVLLRDSEL